MIDAICVGRKDIVDVRNLHCVVGRLSSEAHVGDALRLRDQTVDIGGIEEATVERVYASFRGRLNHTAAEVMKRIQTQIGADFTAKVRGP